MLLHGIKDSPTVITTRQLPHTEALKLPLLLFFMSLDTQNRITPQCSSTVI